MRPILADDLDGDGTRDNQLGMVIGTLHAQNDVTTHAADMIAAGAIASFVELQAPDLTNAATAGARYVGSDGADAVVMSGSIVDGKLASTPTRMSNTPGMAIVHLPVFADADPSIVELDAMEIELTPDGSGGYDALVHGGVREDDAFAAVCDGISQMIYDDPDDHYAFASQINLDGWMTCDKIRDDSILRSFLAPDVKLGGVAMISLSFAVHLVPCASGACAQGPVADPCHDRVQDNGETGVDCGGSCGACPVVPASCSDGVRDGLETDVDCGWNCGKCGLGQHCWSVDDCASGGCTGDQFSLGTCITNPAQ